MAKDSGGAGRTGRNSSEAIYQAAQRNGLPISARAMAQMFPKEDKWKRLAEEESRQHTERENSARRVANRVSKDFHKAFRDFGASIQLGPEK